MLNSDSYALFAGSISEGMPVSVVITYPSLTAGAAIPGSGEATWQARLYFGAELQHPVLGIFNPTLGIGMSVIGESTIGGPFPVTAGPSMLMSLLPGIRIGDPRPGATGGGYASFFGGPSVAVGNSGVGLGAEAGMEHLFTVGASISFLPFQLAVPGQ